MKAAMEIWIDTGYDRFAQGGTAELKVERLAGRVGISKSSFYHHFADVEVFMEHLLRKHLHQSKLIAARERALESIDPGLIHLLLDHKMDLLFNRQLRFHRQDARFREVLEQSNAVVGNDFVQVWLRELSLQWRPAKVQAIFSLALENFYLQINPDNLHEDWLRTYFNELKATIALLEKE